MKKPEKIDRDEWDKKHKAYLKKLTKRVLRRLRKQDPEDSPRRTRDITRGHSL